MDRNLFLIQWFHPAFFLHHIECAIAANMEEPLRKMRIKLSRIFGAKLGEGILHHFLRQIAITGEHQGITKQRPAVLVGSGTEPICSTDLAVAHRYQAFLHG